MSKSLFDGAALRGRLVYLAPPMLSEFELLTGLRNRESVRRWFFDNRPLDPEANSKWLEAHSRLKEEQLLVIRSCMGDLFLGSVGWLQYDETAGSVKLGRVAVDRSRYLALAKLLGYAPRITDEAASLLIAFAFLQLRVSRIRAEVIFGNHSSAALCRRSGFTLVGHSTGRRPSGQSLQVDVFELLRADWCQSDLRKKTKQDIG